MNAHDLSFRQWGSVETLADRLQSEPASAQQISAEFEILDSAYAQFFQQYKGRRQVAYVGANDGMLHAFNAGFFIQGDNPSTTTVVGLVSGARFELLSSATTHVVIDVVGYYI